MNNLISVLLPVYNGDKYLTEAIDSILNQTYINFEFIIINDGSKDNSLEIIRKYEKQDSRIIIINRENRGLIATLNEGIEKSKGKYIARMDQDDISLPNRFEIQLRYMIENKLDICGGNYMLINEQNNILKSCNVPQNEEEILITMASNVPFAHPSVMINKDFLKKNNLKYGLNGYFNAEDLDLWINMFNSKAKFGNINKEILMYRILKNSMSRLNHKKIKVESNNQFNKFMIAQKNKFDLSFKHIAKKDLSNTIQQNLVKANWRYFYIYKKYKFLFFNFKGIKFFNFLKATLSFFKYKVL